MMGKRALIHSVFLFLLPIVAVWFGWSVLTAIAVVLLMLVWRWFISLSTFVLPAKTPDFVLETISASHFVEKVRWNLDRAGIDYMERVSGGTLGAYFTGRTVPRLKARTGAVVSQIGNSAEILRYVWGTQHATKTDQVRHLEPTAERLEFEQRCDSYGRNLQVWVYYHLLTDRKLCLHAWGANNPDTPAWQRLVLQMLFPLLKLLIRRSFRITRESYEKATHRIEDLLADIDMQLADGRTSILGGEQLNYTDFSFAAMTGLWLQPPAYGGGKADAVRIERDRAPDAMRKDIDRWREDYPRAISWVERLYAEQRQQRRAGETLTASTGQTQ